MNRHGAVTVVDESGREREHFTLTYGAFVKVAEGDRVWQGQFQPTDHSHPVFWPGIHIIGIAHGQLGGQLSRKRIRLALNLRQQCVDLCLLIRG